LLLFKFHFSRRGRDSSGTGLIARLSSAHNLVPLRATPPVVTSLPSPQIAGLVGVFGYFVLTGKSNSDHPFLNVLLPSNSISK
jgi:hypothetical protein